MKVRHNSPTPFQVEVNPPPSPISKKVGPALPFFGPDAPPKLMPNGTTVTPSRMIRVLEPGSLEGLQALKRAQDAMREALGTDVELKHLQSAVDPYGTTHVRVQREHRGLRVFGEHSIVHLPMSPTGKVTITNPIKISVKEESGRFLAREDVEKQVLQALAPVTEVHDLKLERVYYKGEDGQFRAAYYFKCTFLDADNEPQRAEGLLDGFTGKIVESWKRHGIISKERLKELQAQAPRPTFLGKAFAQILKQVRGLGAQMRSMFTEGPTSTEGNADTLYYGRVQLDARQVGDEYTLETPDGRITTFDCMNLESTELSDIQRFFSKNNQWSSKENPRLEGATDGHLGGMLTNYAMRLQGFDSVDLKGMALKIHVHFGRDYANAFFYQVNKMVFGDGDGVVFRPLTTIGIAAHEIEHAKTEHTSGLLYRRQSGGRNESNSDVAHAYVMWLAAKILPGVKFTWDIGREPMISEDGKAALRYMDRPKADNYSIDHYSDYWKQTEVHGSSGIGNHAFYQLAETGPDKLPNSTSGKMAVGIGMEKAKQVRDYASAFYSWPTADYPAGRAAEAEAAAYLFGSDSQEVESAHQAWDAVGVPMPKSQQVSVRRAA